MVVAFAPAAPEAVCFSLIAMGGSVRTEKITRIREQLRQGIYHIRATEVAKAILRREPFHASVSSKGRTGPAVRSV